jgi:arginine decarboxylase
MILPKKVFFVKGVGRDKERLKSFELALRNAGIEKFNIVNVSSILPPGCKIIPKDKGLAMLKPGQVIFCVMARNETHEPNRLISAAIGCAVPADTNNYGYLSEHHDFGLTTEGAEDYAEDLAATMLASTLGIEFDQDSSYDEKKEVWKICDQIVRTRAIAQSAIGDKNGLWTSVVAAAVFICDENGN